MRRIGKSEFAKFYSGIDQNEYNKEIQLKIFNLCKNDYKKKNKIENMFNQSIKANEIGLKHEHILEVFSYSWESLLPLVIFILPHLVFIGISDFCKIIWIDLSRHTE